MTDRFYLRGNSLLLIFHKYLSYRGISLFQWMNDLTNQLIDKNKELFIERVENNEIGLSSKMAFVYNQIKREAVNDLIKQEKDFESLTAEELESIKKKLLKK